MKEMKGLLLEDKKGLSVMIGYVLLVVIGITLAVLVYGFLKIYVPTNQPSCPDNIALSIEEFSCSDGALELTLMNRGLFNLDAAYIRIGEEGRVFRELINSQDVFFSDWASEEGLPPGEIWPKSGNPQSYPFTGLGPHILEVQPAMYIENELVLCNEAIITQIIQCVEGELGGPQVSIYSPQEKIYSTQEILINFEILGASECIGILSYTDGIEIKEYSSCTINEIQNLDSGDYTLNVTGRSGDDEKQAIVDFIVDNQQLPDGPYLNIYFPLSGERYINPVPVEFSAGVSGLGDSTLLAGCWYKKTGELKTYIPSCADKTEIVLQNQLAFNSPGEQNLTIYILDSNGLENVKSILFLRPSACTDGIDNDNDNLIDGNDPGCDPDNLENDDDETDGGGIRGNILLDGIWTNLD